MTYRFATTEDAQQLLAIYAPYVLTTPYTFEYEVPSVAQFAQRISNMGREYPYLVYTQGDTIAGYAYAHRYMERSAFGWDVETSIYVSQDAQHRGIGRQLYKRLFLLLELQKVKQAYALITATNTGSLKMHEALGFKAFATFPKVGYKFKKWHDLVYLQREINPLCADPEPVVNITELDSSVVEKILQD